MLIMNKYFLRFCHWLMMYLNIPHWPSAHSWLHVNIEGHGSLSSLTDVCEMLQILRKDENKQSSINKWNQILALNEVWNILHKI